MNKLHALFLAFALTLTSGLALPNAVHAAAEVGKPAPDFTLTDTNGKEHKLSDYRGKYVVLEWVNHGCPFVRKFYGSGTMQKLQKQATDDGVVWLAINSSAPGTQGNMTPEEANRVSKEKNAAHTALLFDGEFETARAYGATATPHMFVIDPEGTLIYGGAIDSIPTAKVEDIEKAENYVLAALDASKAGKPVKNPVTRSYGCPIKFP